MADFTESDRIGGSKAADKEITMMQKEMEERNGRI